MTNYSSIISYSSVVINYLKIDRRQLYPLVQLQKNLSSIFEQNGLLKLQEQMRGSAISRLDEFGKSFVKKLLKIKLPLRSDVFSGISGELTAKPIKGRFSFSSEVETNRVRVEKEETVPITNHILLSKNLTSEEPTSVPIVIDKAETIMLLRIMAQDDFVAGEISSSEIYIEEIAKEYGWQNTMRWLNSIYLDNYSKPAILIGIMHCLSHFEFDNVKPEGQTMALGLLQHEDVFVRDLAIRAYENWNDKEALPILKSLSYDTKWLRDYVDAVVKALEQ